MIPKLGDKLLPILFISVSTALCILGYLYNVKVLYKTHYNFIHGTVCCVSDSFMYTSIKSYSNAMVVDLDDGRSVEVPIRRLKIRVGARVEVIEQINDSPLFYPLHFKFKRYL